MRGAEEGPGSQTRRPDFFRWGRASRGARLLISCYHLSTIFLFVLASLLPVGGQAMAEELLEEIYDEPAPANDAGPPASPRSGPRGRSEAPRKSPWSFGISLGGGAHAVSGSFRADYHLNRFVVPQIGFSYLNIREDDLSRREVGIETPLMLYGANPTVVWPFAGAGPGFIDWRQGDDQGVYDENNSLVGFYLYGILLRFSEHFSFVIQMKTTRYLASPPAKSVTDRGLATETILREEPTTRALSYYFQLSF